jgi:hypothetical protein
MLIRSHSVEGQASRIDERYLFINEMNLIFSFYDSPNINGMG